MNSTAQLIWTVVFGAIGIGFFTYGRRQKAIVPLVTGISLFVIPYFIPNGFVLVLTGCALIALPYFVSF